MKKMKKYELKIIAKLLDIACDKFANHGCNDFGLEFIDEAEKNELTKIISDWNGEEVCIESDSLLMGYFADRVNAIADEMDEQEE